MSEEKSFRDMINDAENSAASKLDRIALREEKENERARKLSNNIALSMNDLMFGLTNIPTSDFPQMNQFNNEQLAQRNNANRPTNMLTEEFPEWDRAPNAQFLTEQKPVKQNNNWRVKQFIAETKSGKEIPVWKVVGKSSVFSLNKVFRIKEIADKIAFILESTNNINDGRILNLIAMYDRRDKLLKESRLIAKNGNSQSRINQINSEISQIDYKLGIS